MEEFNFKNIKELQQLENEEKISDGNYSSNRSLYVDINPKNELDYAPRIITNPLNNCQMCSIGGIDRCETTKEMVQLIGQARRLTMKNMALVDIKPSKLDLFKEIFKTEHNFNSQVLVNQQYTSTRGTARTLLLIKINSPYFLL